ncbi:unnamed protein product [Paramecium primaurelia]|uniref:Uncharacterized protein n=1 Tax=Paramecium primaurelia TaxID=5886 RepID=A0A8S1KKX9_PARPR|nr:unnamed protein product [Paramecium primaurelia]
MSRLYSQICRIMNSVPRGLNPSAIYSPSVYIQALRIHRYQIPQNEIFIQVTKTIEIKHACEQSIDVLDCLSKKKKRARKKQIRRKGNKIIDARNR